MRKGKAMVTKHKIPLGCVELNDAEGWQLVLEARQRKAPRNNVDELALDVIRELPTVKVQRLMPDLWSVLSETRKRDLLRRANDKSRGV